MTEITRIFWDDANDEIENCMSHYRLLEPDDMNLYNDYGSYSKLDILNNDLARITKGYIEGEYTWCEYILACRNYGGWRREILGIKKIFSKVTAKEMFNCYRMCRKIGNDPDSYVINDWTM